MPLPHSYNLNTITQIHTYAYNISSVEIIHSTAITHSKVTNNPITSLVKIINIVKYNFVILKKKIINDNDNDNDNEIDLFRHHNGNNTNIKVFFKQVTMLDKCNCI